MLPQLEELTNEMKEIGSLRNASVAQVAIAKVTLPITGVTKPSHGEDTAQAAKISFTAQEEAKLEGLAAKAGVDTRGSWEKPVIYITARKPWSFRKFNCGIRKRASSIVLPS